MLLCVGTVFLPQGQRKAKIHKTFCVPKGSLCKEIEMKKFKLLLMGAVTLLTAAFMQTTDAKATTDADYLTFTALEDNSSVTFCYC